ncbi:hypothetical protein M758_3G153800 [Ceratodon purpureus]|nr:hypothetical protein M758_3G153800 [Ceratodon purpureus]
MVFLVPGAAKVFGVAHVSLSEVCLKFWNLGRHVATQGIVLACGRQVAERKPSTQQILVGGQRIVSAVQNTPASSLENESTRNETSSLEGSDASAASVGDPYRSICALAIALSVFTEVEGGRHASSELDHEWQARQNQFHTLGYRDGVEAGKNSSVQEGFNVGYAEATVAGFNWGVARGLTSAFAALPAAVKEKLVGAGEARGRLEALEASIRSYSSTDSLRSFYRDLGQTPEVGRSVSDAAQGSQSSEEVRAHGLAALAEGPLDSGDEPGVVSMAGLNRLPESHSGGVWEAGHREEAEQAAGLGRSAVTVESTGSRQEQHVQQPGESSGEDRMAPLSSETPPAAGKSELEELEKRVRTELEVASIKICDVLVGV